MLNAPVEYLIDSGIRIIVIYSIATERLLRRYWIFSSAEIGRFVGSKLPDNI